MQDLYIVSPVILPTLIGLLSTSIFFIVLAAAALIAYRSIYGDNIFISSLIGVKVSKIIAENNDADDDNKETPYEKPTMDGEPDNQSDLSDDDDIDNLSDKENSLFNLKAV